ncbi:hypothetical protein Tco_1257459, partial [Tanacetum coccineum]
VFPMAATARRGRVRFIATCSYSTYNYKDIMKAQVVVGSVVGAGVGVGVDYCGRGVINGIVGGMVGAAAVEVSGITITGMVSVVVVIRDFYKKFYNSLGSVPNRCSVV